MQVLRLNEVLTRVVAWHNRHPLARRIQASQVHSIGEVLLPFASAQPLSGAAAGAAVAAAASTPAPRSGESLADVVSARAAARPAVPATAEALPGLEVHARLPDAPTDPVAGTDLDPFAPEPGEAGEIDGDSTGDVDFDVDSPQGDPVADLVAELAAAAAIPEAEPASPPAPGDNGPGADLAHRVDAPGTTPPAAQAATGRSPASAPLPEPPPPPAAATAVPAWPATAPAGWFRRLWAWLTGRRPGWPRLEAAFSSDFIWPLTHRAVARWAQRHGQLHPLAPADWPRRQVDTDPTRLGPLRQAGLAHAVQLHLLTAAIGVGDRRIRVLMDSDGQIIGPRAYSRPRSAAAAGLLLAALSGAGWQWDGRHLPGDADAAALMAQAAAAAASSASAASAASAVTAAASALAVTDPALAALAASAAAVTVADAATDPAKGPAPEPKTTPAPAPAAGAAHAEPSHPPPPHANAPAAAAPAPPPAAAAIATVSAPSTTAPLSAAAPPADAAPLGRIRPSLSAEDRQLARQQAAALRASPPVAPAQLAGATPAGAKALPAAVYAVVTRPSRQRETAASGLSVMRSAGARLSPPVPEHRELMQQQGEWRAAWWPFANLVDAERARMMLASRGLKAEVVEF